MQIQFPRRVHLGFQPWYGLTIRQLIYLVVAGVAAGALVLFGPVQGSGLIVRLIIGLVIISIGVALAFFRKDGLTAEEWLVTQIKFLLRPQKRVWTRSGSASPRDQNAEILIDQSSAASAQSTFVAESDKDGFSRIRLYRPTLHTATESQAVIVLIDMAMLLSLFSLAVYLLRGGLSEIQGWFLTQLGH